MKYKMLVSDFDGTLFRSDYTVSEETHRAISEYESIGGKFFIATGRLFSAIKPYAEKLGARAEIVTYQGGAIFDMSSGEMLYSKSIDCNLATEIYTFLYENYANEAVPIMFHQDRCIAKEKNAFVDKFTGIVKVEGKYVGQNLDEYVRENGISPNKLLCLVNPAMGREITFALRERFDGRINVNQSHSTLLEIVNIDASKGNAVKWLAEKYGVAREEIICIGDAENDNSMIKYAGLGVAVGNAMDITKEVADFISDTNDNDGVAKIIRDFCLGGTKTYE